MPAQSGFFIQFLKLAGPFWNSENKVVIRLQTLTLIALTVMQMGLAVIVTEWSAVLFDALEQHSMVDLFKQIGYLVLIFLASMAVTVMHLKMKRHLHSHFDLLSYGISVWTAWLQNYLCKNSKLDYRPNQ